MGNLSQIKEMIFVMVDTINDKNLPVKDIKREISMAVNMAYTKKKEKITMKDIYCSLKKMRKEGITREREFLFKALRPFSNGAYHSYFE